jgi:PAS domain S-box-containing protein
MQFFNDMLEPITGYRADELKFGDVCSIDPLIIPEDRGNVIKSVRESVRGNRPYEIEYRLKRKDGGIGYLYESGRPIYVDGEPLYIDGIILDVSERKQAEEALKKAYRELQETKDQLIQAGRLAALGQLASGAAHEIRNPLHVMSMRLQMFEIMGKDLKENDRKVIDVCNAQIKRVLQILEGLDEFSQTPVTDKTLNNLNRIVENVVASWDERFRNHGIATEIRYREDIPSFMFDKEKIAMVITHLISNAVDAMRDRETRKLGISTEKASTGESVRIQVSDTGHGISEMDRARIFDPFFTTKGPDKGKGLGLAVAYGIIRDHGGRIWVENNDEGGASFFIELPVSASENVY